MSIAEHLPSRGGIWRRHSITLTDGLVAVAATLAQVTAAAAAGRHGGQQTGVAEYLLIVAGGLVLVARRVHPRAVLALVTAFSLAYWSLGNRQDPLFISQAVALVAAMVRGHRLAGWLSLAIGYVGFLGLGRLAGGGHIGAGFALALGAWLLVFGAGTELLRIRVERAAEARRSRRQESLRRAGEERLQIARELHDVLAHNISLINVQAGVALHLLDEHPEKAEPALKAIKAASAEALRETRSVLGALRESDERAPRDPAPSLSRLDELVTRMQAVGLCVMLDADVGGRPPSAAVDLAAYRIVQEALTNIARHSEGAEALVRVRHGGGGLEIEVSNDDGGRRGSIVEGNGIVGMRERALGLGGEFEAGREAGGRFAVRARIPYEAVQ